MWRWPTAFLAGVCACALGCGSAYGPAPDAHPDLDTQLQIAASECPLITSLRIVPLSTSIGNNIDLAAGAVDEGRGLSFTWFASNGAFDDATSKDATYTCTVAGDQDIVLVVTDGQCGDLAQVPVACVKPGQQAP